MRLTRVQSWKEESASTSFSGSMAATASEVPEKGAQRISSFEASAGDKSSRTHLSSGLLDHRARAYI
jgi:hypothetical protein